MAIRLALWLGMMICAALVLVAQTVLATAIQHPLVAGAAVLVLFMPIGWFLAWLAYHPVRGVTRTTRSIITSGELDRRNFYPGPRDDIGDLVVTVNELLVRYDAAVGRLRRLRTAPPACACPREAASPDPADLVVVDLCESRHPS